MCVVGQDVVVWRGLCVEGQRTGRFRGQLPYMNTVSALHAQAA